MTVKDFLEKLGSIEVKIETISAVYRTFVYEFKDEVLNYDENFVRDILQRFSAEDFASFGVKLGRCLSDCKEERKNLSAVAETPYAQNVVKVEQLIEKLVTIYYEVANNNSSKKDSTTTAIAQHDEYLQEVKGKLKSLNDDIVAANKLIDDKIFSLLINTVAILGIFVAIAFAGFGVSSIFSNLDFTQAFTSSANLVKSVFFLLLVTLLSYNLLLLLVYFIYKLSRPILVKTKNCGNEDTPCESFSQTIHLTPFLWVDAIVFIVTIGLFIWCQFI